MKTKLILVIIVGLILNWKLIRMTGIINNEINFLWDLHVYFMIIMMFISLNYLPKSINLMDSLFIFCIFSFTISLIVNGVLSNLEFAVKFILPSFIFFIAKYYGKHYISESKISTLSLILSFNILLFSYLDYLSQNVITPIIDYNSIDIIMDGSGRMFNTMYTRIVHPIFAGTMRPVGPALTLHASSVLFASLSIYHLSEFKKSAYKPKYHLIASILYLYLIFLAPVGQGVLVYALLIFVFLIMSRSLFIKIIALPLASSLILIGMLQAEHTFYSLFIEVYKYGNTFLKLSINDIASYILFGSANPSGDILAGEIYFIALIFVIGIFGYSIFFILFYTFIKYCTSLKKHGYNYSSYMLVTMGLIFGSIHYNSTFMFPSTLIIYASFGYISGKHDLSKKIILLRNI